MSKRLFIALEPSGACREQVAEARETLVEAFPDARIRWQPDVNLHLTLAFLGNVDDDLLEDCRERLAACARRARSFDLRTTRLGAFPSALRPSVVWLGIEADPAGALASLHRDLAGAYRHIRDDRRPFRPHITLGRVKGMGGSDRTAFATALTELPEGSTEWRCDRVVLFESTLSAGGAVHAPLLTVELSQ